MHLHLRRRQDRKLVAVTTQLRASSRSVPHVWKLHLLEPLPDALLASAAHLSRFSTWVGEVGEVGEGPCASPLHSLLNLATDRFSSRGEVFR